MNSVEVFKGPSSIEYGPQTIGGAINFVSAPVPTGDLLDIGLGGGSDGYRSAHFRGGTQISGFGLLAEYLHIGSDGFKELDGGGDTGFGFCRPAGGGTAVGGAAGGASEGDS